MKPYPLFALNHFTTPSAKALDPLSRFAQSSRASGRHLSKGIRPFKRNADPLRAPGPIWEKIYDIATPKIKRKVKLPALPRGASVAKPSGTPPKPPVFALWATPRSPVAIPPRASPRDILAEASETLLGTSV